MAPLAMARRRRAGWEACYPVWMGLCYNGAAVEQLEERPAENAGEMNVVAVAAAGEAESEDASRYCPVCSKRLESRRCKLICGVCGYYMSCADYY